MPKKNIEKCNWEFPERAETPLTTSCRPELDMSSELNATDLSCCQSLIGVQLFWGLVESVPGSPSVPCMSQVPLQPADPTVTTKEPLWIFATR